MNKKMKLVAILTAFVLVIGIAVGGTLAWLTDTTDSVTNTFTMGNIEITLDETTGNEYKMVPGGDIVKDPKVTVLADSEECWLFVKIEKANGFDNFMDFTIAEGWTVLDGADGVYYREVDASATDQKFGVIKDDTVTVKTTVTKEMFAGLDQDSNGSIETSELPALTFTAYAIQTVTFENAAEAWAEISTPTP